MSTVVTEVASQLEPTPSGAPGGRGRTRGLAYLGRRLLGALSSLAFVVVLNFFLFRVLSGNPVRTLSHGRTRSPEQIAEQTHRLGLDQPLFPQQFWTYIKGMLHLDFGDSFQYSRPVSGLILDRLWPTVVLVGTSTLLATVIGLYLGVISAWNRGRPVDKITSTGTLILYSMPEWWLGLLLFAVFAVGLGPIPGMFPIGGLVSPGVDQWSLEGIVDQAWHLVLPVVTLTLAYLAEYSLIMRSALLDEMGEDYLQTARAKGLRDVIVRRRHATRNALLPVTTLVALNIGFVVSGAITIEAVFSIPGLGLLSYEAIAIPDFPLLQGLLFYFSAAVILANLVANLLYSWLDPRVRT
jgi:peptide/nickel transport system permease protein